MATVRRPVPGALLAAALAVVTVACGSSQAPPRAVMLSARAVVDPLAGQTSVWIVRHASDNTVAAFDVHLTGAVEDSGHRLTFDLSVAGSDGCTGTVTEPKTGSFRLIFDGATVWVKPDDEFWRVAGGITDPAQLASVRGKYLTAAAGGSSLGEIASMCQLKTLLKDFTSIPANTPGETKGRVTDVSGQRALKVSDTRDSAYVYVTDTAQPRLLRLIDPSAAGDKFSFGYPGTPVAIAPPPASEILVGGQ